MSVPYTTGLPELDRLVGGIERGDNIVWRVDTLADYRAFCHALAGAERRPRRALYFRFAGHPAIFSEEEIDRFGVQEIRLSLDRGFEFFITSAHRHILDGGDDAVLFFDSLSDLSHWFYSDRMIGNFFQLTCPLILETGSEAYFSLDRFFHSYHTVEPVTATTQILADVYRLDDSIYIQLEKVDNRPEARTFILHRWEADGCFTPVTASARIVPVLASRPWPGLRSASYRMVGVWDRAFMEGDAILHEVESGRYPQQTAEDKKEQLLGLIISREDRILELAREHLTLGDILAIWKRMIGTGFIGGKSVGMLLARAILRRNQERWGPLLEEHDSFFVGSDVYYTFLVINQCWWERQRQKDPESAMENNETVRDRILRGEFPRYILERFSDMIDYYGTSPIIVRSSSLLEDNFGNAFAGKYESVFCTMQGSRGERMEEFLTAVRRIYASTVSDEALHYRKSRGILHQDEQMALLVQRVSGEPRGRWFYPQLAGVAFSFNPYAWHESIDASSGLMRLVFGLGTRAVNRSDDDYTRVVALNAPEKRPEADFSEVRRHAQRRVDVLDLAGRSDRSVEFTDLLKDNVPIPLNLLATRDRELARGRDVDGRLAWVLTFDRLLRSTHFVQDLREMLAELRDAYRSDVDVEFTVNFLDPESDSGEDQPRHLINLVQCRPFQIQGAHIDATPLPTIAPEQVIMRCNGGVVGHSRVDRIGRIVFVRPERYAELPEARKYELTRVIAALTQAKAPEDEGLLLIGPGRWGTSTPSLGVPVRIADIDRVTVLVEIDQIHDGLIADLSLGTHFFNELVERNMLYLAYKKLDDTSVLDRPFLDDHPNRVPDLLSESASSELAAAALFWSDIVTVIDSPGRPWILNANGQEQFAVLYREDLPG